MACNLTSTDEEEEDEEHFPTALLNDDIPDRHLCIHEHSQHDLCPYPCPYSLDQLHLTPDYTPQYMDLSDIFNFQDVITTTSDEDVQLWIHSWTLINCAIRDIFTSTDKLCSGYIHKHW